MVSSGHGGSGLSLGPRFWSTLLILGSALLEFPSPTLALDVSSVRSQNGRLALQTAEAEGEDDHAATTDTAPPTPSVVLGLPVTTTQSWMLYATGLCAVLILSVLLLELLCKLKSRSLSSKSSEASAQSTQEGESVREAVLRRARRWLQTLFFVYLVTFNLTVSAAINESHRLFGDLGFGSAASGWMIGLPVALQFFSSWASEPLMAPKWRHVGARTVVLCVSVLTCCWCLCFAVTADPWWVVGGGDGTTANGDVIAISNGAVTIRQESDPSTTLDKIPMADKSSSGADYHGFDYTSSRVSFGSSTATVFVLYASRFLLGLSGAQSILLRMMMLKVSPKSEYLSLMSLRGASLNLGSGAGPLVASLVCTLVGLTAVKNTIVASHGEDSPKVAENSSNSSDAALLSLNSQSENSSDVILTGARAAAPFYILAVAWAVFLVLCWIGVPEIEKWSDEEKGNNPDADTTARTASMQDLVQAKQKVDAQDAAADGAEPFEQKETRRLLFASCARYPQRTDLDVPYEAKVFWWSGLAFSVIRQSMIAPLTAAMAVVLEVEFFWDTVPIGYALGYAALASLPAFYAFYLIGKRGILSVWQTILLSSVVVALASIPFFPSVSDEMAAWFGGDHDSKTEKARIESYILLASSSFVIAFAWLRSAKLDALAQAASVDGSCYSQENFALLDQIALLVQLCGPALGRWLLDTPHGRTAYAAAQLVWTVVGLGLAVKLRTATAGSSLWQAEG